MDANPNVQDIPEIVGRYLDTRGSGVLFVSFCQHQDASYDLSGKVYKNNINFQQKFNIKVLVTRQETPMSPVTSSHLFHGEWDKGENSREFRALTVSDKFMNETKNQVYT